MSFHLQTCQYDYALSSRENQTLLTNSYYYCSTKTCPIAYFSNRGKPIPKSHLISYHAIQNETLCYCFDITAIKYVSALKAQCAEPIKNFVIQRTKTGECACEIKKSLWAMLPSPFQTLGNWMQIKTTKESLSSLFQKATKWIRAYKI